MKRNLYFILILILIPPSIYSQKFYEKNFYGGIFYLSDYINSEEFNNKLLYKNDLEKVDSLYSKCLSFFYGNISESLLCLTFACLPFNKIDLKLFSIKIKIPLPSPSKNIFEKRFKNLPSKLFFNSPQNEFGDKDKLSHFFGNAFLRYNFSPFNFSKFIGIFVETTEQNFFANGGLDYRDLVANNLGEIFGEMLKKNKNAKPSKALLIYQLLFFRDKL